MPLRPAQTFNLAVASLALALIAEGALLWKASQNPRYAAPAPTPQIVAAAPTPLPYFVAPGISSAPTAPSFAPGNLAPKPGAAPPKATNLPPDKAALAKTYFEAGTTALSKKDNAAALTNFLKVVEIAPDHLPTRLNLAMLYLGDKKPLEALPHLQKAVQLDPKGAGPRFELARTYLALKRTDEAVAPLREVLKLTPKEREPRALLAQIYISQKKLNAAYDLWASQAKSDPHDVDAHLQAAGLAADGLKKPAEAEKWLRKAVASEPRDPRPALLLGRLLLAENKNKAAALVLTKASKARPDVFEIFTTLANARLASGDLSGARVAIQSALLRVPAAKTEAQKGAAAQIEGGLHFTLGRILGQSKKPKEAASEFQRAAKLVPRDPEIRSMLALAAAQSGDRKTAIDALQVALQIDPKRAADRRLLGQVYADAKNWSGANAQYEAYTKLQPRDGNALVEWAQLAARFKKSAAEKQIWLKLAALDPKNPLPYQQMGAGLRDDKQPVAALANFEKALQLNGNDPSTLFEIAQLQTKLKKSSAAAATWQKLITLQPNFAPAYASYLEASSASGDSSGARLFLARQLAKTENPPALVQILRFYEKTKRNTEAQALLTDIVKRNPKSRAAKAALDSFQTPAAESTPAAPSARATP